MDMYTHRSSDIYMEWKCIHITPIRVHGGHTHKANIHVYLYTLINTDGNGHAYI